MESRQTPSLALPNDGLSASLEPLKTQRAGGLVAQVVSGLNQAMRDGKLQPGDKLPTESAIMAQYAVSRTVVREALSKLQAANLVETRHGIGTFVIAPQASDNFKIADPDMSTMADVISILELRISLETEAAGLAAQRRTLTHLDVMQAALAAFQESIAGDSDAVPSDFAFHMEVARATGNRHFTDLMTYLGTMIIPRTRVNVMHRAPEGRLAYLQRVNGEHESILTAIRNQDSEAARAAMRTHLSNSRERLRQTQLRVSGKV